MLAFLAYTHACGDVPLGMVLSKRSRMETMRCPSSRGGRFFRIVLTVVRFPARVVVHRE